MPRQMPEIREAITALYGGTPVVFGCGPVPCAVMMIGEAPGAKEIEAGTPFCGQAGGNLSSFLEQLGLNRSEIYITNVCKFRPVRIREGRRRTVSNRTPTAAEIAAAVPVLRDEIDCVDPRIIITLGNTPLRAVSGCRDMNIGSVHGTCVLPADSTGRCIFALYHPASIIYNPRLKADYEADLDALRSRLAEMGLLGS